MLQQVIDDAIYDSFRKAMGLDEFLTLVCVEASYLGKRNTVDPCVIIITESTFYAIVVNQKDSSKPHTEQFDLRSIKKLAFSEKQMFVIHDHGQITVHYKDITNNIGKVLVSYMKNVFLDRELPHFDNIKQIIPEHMDNAMLYRFRYLLAHNNAMITDSQMKEFKAQCEKKNEPDFASIAGFGVYNDLLFDALQVNMNITRITFPPSSNLSNFWQLLGKFVETHIKCVAITTNDPVDSKFLNFVESIKKIRPRVLHGMRFNDSYISQSGIENFIDFLASAKLKSLTLSNAMTAKVLHEMLAMLSTKKGFTDHIESIKFAKMQDLNPKIIISNISTIKNLSFENCTTDVADILKAIPLATQLESFSIQGSTAHNPIDKTIVFPKTLTDFQLCHIGWENMSFCDAFEVINKHKPDGDRIDLDMSEAYVPEETWSIFFERVRGASTDRLRRITFNANPPVPHFYSFLSNLPNLTYLSLSGSFKPDTAPIFPHFAQFIAKNTTIKHLVIAGNEYGQAESHLTTIFKGLERNKKIRKLDISNQKIGDEGMIAFANMLKVNKSITNIWFSKNNIQKPETLIYLYDILKERVQKTAFDFPMSEFHRMRKKKLIDFKTIKVYEKLHKKIINKKKSKIVSHAYSTSRLPTLNLGSFNPSSLAASTFNSSTFTTTTLAPPSIESTFAQEPSATPKEVLDPDWEMPFKPIPKPDNSALIEKCLQDFTAVKLGSALP